jgi:ubiquinone/menaquinone biosynthesis C-methylase UbiE
MSTDSIVTNEAPALFDSLKERQRSAWSSGDYAMIGTTLQIVGESLSEAVDMRAGQKVLDVAAGNGNASLAAARRWAHVTAVDYVPALLERAGERAKAERLWIDLREGDAEALPFKDETFDVVLSTFGVMFTPNQEKAAAEMLRVCRPGGKIGMANWTPEGFVGQMFKIIGKYIPPMPGVKPPSAWGTEARLRELFGPSVTIVTTRRNFVFRYQTPEHFVDVFREFYGPMVKAFAALDSDHKAQLTTDLLQLLRTLNQSGDRTLVLPSEYLEVVILR